MAIPIGTSGWSYDHWAGILYPRKASSLVRLDTYAQQFETVEVNNTFYRWLKDQVFTTWHDRPPQGFLVSVKASRGFTQFRKLHDPDSWLERMESGLTHLGKKRGVLLVQLQPHFGRNLERLDLFLASVPSHQRTAVEFRHPSWTETVETFALLERRRAA